MIEIIASPALTRKRENVGYIGYIITCLTCHQAGKLTTYDGESSRNGYARGLEHLQGLRTRSTTVEVYNFGAWWRRGRIQHGDGNLSLDMLGSASKLNGEDWGNQG